MRCDRDGSFEPELVKKGQTRIDGVDDRIIGLYALGLSVRDIQAHLEELYGLRVSGPVTYLCRPECSFRPLDVRRPRGFCLPRLSADGAGYRSR